MDQNERKTYLFWSLALHFPGDGLNVVAAKLFIGLDKLLEVTLRPVGETLIQISQSVNQLLNQCECTLRSLCWVYSADRGDTHTARKGKATKEQETQTGTQGLNVNKIISSSKAKLMSEKHCRTCCSEYARTKRTQSNQTRRGQVSNVSYKY